MRGDFAAKMGVAHCVGLFGVAIAGTVMSSDPDADEAIMLFVVGAIASLFIFLPVLAVSVAFAPDIIRHRFVFLLLGPLAVTALVSALFCAEAWKPIAFQTGLSSLVLFLLLRGEDDPDSSAA